MPRPPRRAKPANPFYLFLAQDPRPEWQSIGDVDRWRQVCRDAGFEPLHAADFPTPSAIIERGDEIELAKWRRWSCIKHLLSADVVIADLSGPQGGAVSPVVAYMMAIASAAQIPVVAFQAAPSPGQNIEPIEVMQLLHGPADSLVIGDIVDAVESVRSKVQGGILPRKVPPAWIDLWLLQQRPQ